MHASQPGGAGSGSADLKALAPALPHNPPSFMGSLRGLLPPFNFWMKNGGHCSKLHLEIGLLSEKVRQAKFLFLEDLSK